MDIKGLLKLESYFNRWVAAYVTAMREKGIRETGLENIDERLARAFITIQDANGRADLTVAEVARKSGLSISHFNRLFRSAMNESPSSFITRKTLERVIRCVEEEGWQLKALAYELGFGTPQHFSRWFKTQTGLSPRTYFA